MSQRPKLRHILELTKEEKRKFITSFDIIFSDCDGVLWLATEPIKNSDKAVNLLKNAGKKFICVSNNSMRTDKEYIEKLNGFGVSDVTEDNFVHPVKTIIRYLKKNKFSGPIFSIADDGTFNKSLKDSGFEVLDSSHPHFTDMNDFSRFIKNGTNKLAKAVIFDIDVNMSIAKIVRAQYYLQQPDCIFIIGASDRFIPMHKDFNIVGPDAFIKLLSEVSGKEAIILGKPGKLLGEYLTEHYDVKIPQRALFIGDALPQDIGFGRLCNFQTLAVLSGATSKDTLFQHKNNNEIPDYYADSLEDFIQFFNELS